MTSVARLTLLSALLTAVLYAFGMPWWLPAAAGTAAVVVRWRRLARAARPGLLAVPTREGAHVLWAMPERAAFDRAVAVSRRIRRTWPALRDMVDPMVADRALTRALDDLAAVMARRQEIRRLRQELAEVRAHDVPADSPALAALAAQRQRVEGLWLSSAEQANRILRSLDAAALAGEAFLREQRVGETARAAEQVLAALSAGPQPTGTGPELAGHTEAVINAYRELDAA